MNQQPANEVNDVAPSSLSHLIGQRGAITAALQALDAPQFVATPRTPEPLSAKEVATRWT